LAKFKLFWFFSVGFVSEKPNMLECVAGFLH